MESRWKSCAQVSCLAGSTVRLNSITMPAKNVVPKPKVNGGDSRTLKIQRIHRECHKKNNTIQ